MVIRVQTRDNEPVDKSLRRLRKLCNNEGVTRTAKAKNYFEKPSERRRREKRERLKAIRLSTRAKRQELDKLLERRRKARKNSRLAAMRSASENAAGGESDAVLPEDGPDKTEGSAAADATNDVARVEEGIEETQPETGDVVTPEEATPVSEEVSGTEEPPGP